MISYVSIIGIALGICALIVVTSIMNGFQKEIYGQMLSAHSHIEILSRDSGVLNDWQDIITASEQLTGVTATAPFLTTQTLVLSASQVIGAIVNGVVPEKEKLVNDVFSNYKNPEINYLQPGSFKVIIGYELARKLNINVGEKLTLVSLTSDISLTGALPRVKTFNVAGTFSSGRFDIDSSRIFLNLHDAQLLYQKTGPTGIRLRLSGLGLTRVVQDELKSTLRAEVFVRSWIDQNRTWFDAVKIEKKMMTIILFLIVVVGCFNLVTALVMSVTQKQSDIAILRTLGASPQSIMLIFATQGSLAGIAGTMSGVLVGLLISFNIEYLTPVIDVIMNSAVPKESVGIFRNIPSNPNIHDVVGITFLAVLLSLFSTIYPSWKASRVRPAEALRYE